MLHWWMDVLAQPMKLMLPDCRCGFRCSIFTPLAREEDHWPALMPVALCAWDRNRLALIQGQSVMGRASCLRSQMPISCWAVCLPTNFLAATFNLICRARSNASHNG